MEGPVGRVLRRRLMVTTPSGLHLRPATALAQTAARYESTVTVFLGGRRADGKSALALLLLSAPWRAELDLEVRGPDARDALEALVGLLTDSSWAEPVGDPAAE